MKKIRMLAALCAVFLLAISFSTVAYAGGFDEPPEGTAAPVAETPAPVTESVIPSVTQTNPFTPAGTGTVVDNATDGDGKEFYTIITANENVFYLIIDRQRDSDNVYFLNAVTEQDLLALAVPSEKPGESESVIPETPVAPVPTPTPEVSPEPVPEPETGGNAGMMILVVFIILVGGGAGYYFKIYRPKQEQAAAVNEYEDGEEYDEYVDEGPDTYGLNAQDATDDNPPWDEDVDESAGDGDE